MKKIAPLLVLIAATLWGSNGVFVNLLKDSGFSPIQRTSIRMVIAVLLEALILFCTSRESFKIDKKGFFWSMLTGIFGMYLFLVLYTLSIARVGMAVAGVLIYLMPGLVMAYSCIFEKEKFTLYKGIALAFNLAGCALVSGIASGGMSDPLGILSGLLAALFYAFNNIAVGSKLKKYSATTKMFYPALGAGLCALIYLVIFTDVFESMRIVLSNGKILMIFVLWAICCSIATYYCFNTAIAYMPISSASLLSTFEPVAAVLFGVFLFHESLDLFGILGVILVIVSLIIAESKK